MGDEDKRATIKESAEQRQRIGELAASETARKRAEEALEHYIKRLEMLQQVELELTAQLDLDILLFSIVSRATELLEGTVGGLYLCRQEQDVLELAVTTAPSQTPVGSILHRGEGLAGKVWERGELIMVDDYRHWAGRAAVYEDHPWTAIVGVPVCWGEEFLGVLNVLADSSATFSTSDAELLNMFATHAAVAIANARLYEQAQARSRYLETLQRINSTLRSTLPLSQVLETIARGAGEALNYAGALIAIPDATGERLTMDTVWGGRFIDAVVRLTGLEAMSFELSLTAEENPIVRAYLSGELQVTSGEPERVAMGFEPVVSPKLALVIARAMGVRQAVYVPLPVGETVTGVLVVFSSREQLSSEELTTLLGLADQAGLAIENARLYEALKQELAERKQAEEALRESEEKYRTLVERANDGITIVQDMLLKYANPRLAEVTGYTVEELVDTPFTHYVHPDELPKVIDRYERRMAGEDVTPVYETAIKHRDGSRIDVEFNAGIITYQERSADLVIIRDITGRKRAEEALRLRIEQLDALSRASQAVTASLELDQVLAQIVPLASQVSASDYSSVVLVDESGRMGQSAENVPGVPAIKYRVRDEGLTSWIVRSHQAAVIDEIGEDGSVTPDPGEGAPRFANPLIVKAGVKSLAGVPLMVKDRLLGVLYLHSLRPGAFHGQLPLLTAFANQVAIAIENARLHEALEQELTGRKRLEEQLLQAQKMEAVGRLAGGVAHDFNNVLTAITGYADLLLMNLGDLDPWRKDVEEIKKAADRASTLTHQLLAFSRKQVLQPRVLNLNAVVANMEKMLRRLIREDIDLVAVLDPALGNVKADPGQTEQVIMNLAVNARDAMPQGGKLTIETMNVYLDEDYARQHVDVQPGPYVMLAVSDTGIGMNEETLSYIFEPFFTTKEKDEGTGLGLSTVYGIVKQSGGHIWVYSEPGQGTTFKVYLPQVEEVIELLEPSSVPTELPQGSETVLLVENADIVRGLAHRVLLQNGYTVLEARHGEEAFLICEQHEGPIHLLVTDVVMPGMSGRELAERLTTSYPETKVLYMSGHTDNAIVRHGVLEPDIAFLQKPFTPDVLARKVREVLDGGKR
jgi:PAS domain S-box-containing protein